MGISIYNIKKWTKMLTGKSILHVNQKKGTLYEKNKIKGYYNDLTEKVIKSKLKETELPKIKDESGEEIEFPIAIFQYGLGAYDLFLGNNGEKELDRFKLAVKWTMENQLDNGGWKCFEKQSPNNPFSSMAQGEGASILIRAYTQCKEKKYLEAAKKAIYFMIKPEKEGGTTIYTNNEVYFKEFAGRPVVLNGWIFSIFGLYDYLLVNNEDYTIKEIYQQTINTLINNLEKFDLKYWSKYDMGDKIASPFYHKLHSSLLYVLSELTEERKLKLYAEKFENYQKNFLYRKKAFVIKAIQKIMEK